MFVIDPDRVLGLPLLNLLFLAVSFRIAHRMPTKPVCHDFKEKRAFSTSAKIQIFLGSLIYLENIHPVDPIVSHSITLCLLAHLGYGRSAFDSSAHAVLVILTHPSY